MEIGSYGKLDNISGKCFEEILRERIGRIKAADGHARRAAREHWDSLAKPVDGLGRFEELIVDIAGASGSPEIMLKKRAVVVMCGDHGVTAEGVSQTDSTVTLNVANAVASGTSTVNMMASAVRADVYAIDMGIAADSEKLVGNVTDMKVRQGTGNIAAGPAMTREEACQAIVAGMDVAGMLDDSGYNIVVNGEMGIGNTTPMTAIACVLTGIEPRYLTGRGAGLSDEGLQRKINAVERALSVNKIDAADAIDILSKVGGLEIAGMVGLFLGCAEYHIPAVVDVSVSSSAAVLASMICPYVTGYMLMSCAGREPAAAKLAEMLGKKTVIDADMALGEGTSGVMLLPLIDIVLNVYNNGRTFDDAGITAYERF